MKRALESRCVLDSKAIVENMMQRLVHHINLVNAKEISVTRTVLAILLRFFTVDLVLESSYKFQRDTLFSN